MIIIKNILLIVLLALTAKVFSQSFVEIKRIKQSTKDYSEFGASYFGNGIVYCSNTRKNIIISRQSEENKSFYNVYYAPLNDSSQKTNTSILTDIINTNFNDGPVTTNGKILVFSRNYEPKKSENNEKTNVGLFICNKKDSTWLNPIPFPYNDEKFNLGHPSINNAGNALYFTSDKPSGFGKFDIYVSYLKNGNWSTPENLGKEINSSESDLFPFIFQDNRLYFSNNNFDSTYTFDIFYSDLQEGHWSKPIRLSEPINSKYNDFGFICDNTTENGFFTSDRKGNDDIFKFYSILPAFEIFDTMMERNYCYHFVEEKTVDLDTMPVVYEWDFGDSVKVKSFEADHCFSGPGAYNVSLNMIDTQTGEIYKMIASYLLSVEDPTGPYIICENKVKVGTAIEFDGSETNLPDKIIDQYIWSFSDNKKFVGKKITRIFDKPGTYQVYLGVVFDKDKTGKFQKKCVFKEIVVE
jgi:hypothetical protein